MADVMALKVTNKKGAGFYSRAAKSFFKGMEAEEASDGKPAVEAKAPVDELKISGLGEATNVAVAVAAKLDADGTAEISNVQTAYPEMTSGRGCPQITISMKKVTKFVALPSIEHCGAGPHEKSNWLIPDALLAGAYPGSKDEPEHSAMIKQIIDAGVTTFVCLMEKPQLKGHKHPPYAFKPYKEEAKQLAGERRLQFLLAEIPDGHVAADKVARSAAETIIRHLKAGEVCYVHCWGGNGRTGTICSIVLARLYNIEPSKAIQHFQASHAQRKIIVNRFPESKSQKEQVELLGNEKQGEGEGAADDLPELIYPL
eukprot:TRINITY_DN42864_c0_g1_i1.p1 TRINITY_DN42864_c0_g1~~TRINITY_DN42864_c0_g1_i1.p1  ORF type:complete len:314 (+),score=71.35 TRINITY_DN42864_c0_g1_i1:88-1029(+)